MGTGFALPSEVANTYDPTTDAFNWQGDIKAWFEDGGFGLALMSAPYLAGTLWGKIFRGSVDHAKMPIQVRRLKISMNRMLILLFKVVG